MKLKTTLLAVEKVAKPSFFYFLNLGVCRDGVDMGGIPLFLVNTVVIIARTVIMCNYIYNSIDGMTKGWYTS